MHDQDMKNGCTKVYLPYALEKKFPGASADLRWQSLFLSSSLSLDPSSKIERRHHISKDFLQRDLNKAMADPDLIKEEVVTL